jgi:hypothetical protein
MHLEPSLEVAWRLEDVVLPEPAYDHLTVVELNALSDITCAGYPGDVLLPVGEEPPANLDLR